jgi:hypothetical protein
MLLLTERALRDIAEIEAYSVSDSTSFDNRFDSLDPVSSIQ